MMGLTSQEFELEPADELFTNLYISGQIQKKQDLESKYGQ